MPPADSDSSRPRRTGDRAFAAGVVLVVVLALLVRWPMLDQGPGYANRDELNYVPKAIRFGGGDLDPHYFHNPPLTSYLMFAGELVWYAAGRASGAFASPADFKAQYVVDGAPAFFVARLVVLAIGVAGVVHAAYFARSLVDEGLPTWTRRVAGWGAGVALAVSALHAAKSACATNEVVVAAMYALAAHAAVRVVRVPSAGRVAVAGALVGISAATKYTGALAAIPVVVACASAPSIDAKRRLQLIFLAGAASVAAFVVACPWVALDARAFFAGVAGQASLRDRAQDGLGWKRYLETAWGEGLGPVWASLFVVAVVAAVVGIVRGPAERRGPRLVLLAAAAGLWIFLSSWTSLAYGRYLLPVFPVCVAFAAAEVAALGTPPSRRGTWLVAAASAGCAFVAAIDVPAAWRARGGVDARDEMAAWMRGNVPDGARVIMDLYPPWLVDCDVRREFEGGKVPAATWARLAPAYRLTAAYDRFDGPVLPVVGTDVSCGDWRRIGELGPAYVVVTSAGRALFSKLPPGERPGDRWQKSVASSLDLVHAVDRRGPGGFSVYLYRVPSAVRK
jgi:hypothetical protein